MKARLLALTLLAFVLQLAAQQQTSTESPRVSDILQRMKSADSAEREKAFDEASKLLASVETSQRDLDRLRLSTIQLLIAENAKNNISAEEMAKLAANTSCGDGTDNCEGDDESDESSDYFPKLIATVASFNDERGIPALVGAMPWGGEATKTLLAYGDKALGPVLAELKSRNYPLRRSALDTGITILEIRNDVASRTRVRELIEASVNDPSPAFRSHAVQKIVCLGDRQDFVPTLERVAKTDPWKLPGKVIDGGDGGQFYPVRYEARRALRAIQGNEICPEKPLTNVN